MQSVMKWLLVAAASACIAMLLSLLPKLDTDAIDASTSRVQSQDVPYELTDDNLVDRMVRLSLRLDLARVDWNGSRLSLDLVLNDTGLTTHDIYEELFVLCQFVFAETTNVEQLLVRVVARENERTDSRMWLVALDAARADWDVEQAEAVIKQETKAERFLHRHVRVRVSGIWPGEDS